MASFDTTTYDAQETTRVRPGKHLLPNIASGDIQFAVVPYALAATEASTDTINLCKLPVGAIPIPGLSFVDCEDPGTTLTVDIGTSADTDGLADGIVLSSGGHVLFTSATMPAAALTPTPLTVEDVFVTVATAASLTAAAKLVFCIAYKPGR